MTALRPSGDVADGFFADWTPTPSGAHYACVNESSPDADVSYLLTTANTSLDLTFPALVGSFSSCVLKVYARNGGTMTGATLKDGSGVVVGTAGSQSINNANYTEFDIPLTLNAGPFNQASFTLLMGVDGSGATSPHISTVWLEFSGGSTGGSGGQTGPNASFLLLMLDQE